MKHNSIRRSIERIKQKKMNLKSFEEKYERIRALQIKLVKLSFIPGEDDAMKRIVEELKSIRSEIRNQDKAA